MRKTLLGVTGLANLASVAFTSLEIRAKRRQDGGQIFLTLSRRDIVASQVLPNMALLADGWHMSSHALALGLSLVAYIAARRLAGNSRFTFGTWKIEILGGYSSAIVLVLVAALMLYQSVERLISPITIHYDEAIAIGIVGLLVNLACAWLLRGGHHHSHYHSHEHHHHDDAGHHHDLNLRSVEIRRRRTVH